MQLEVLTMKLSKATTPFVILNSRLPKYLCSGQVFQYLKMLTAKLKRL